MNAYKRIKTSFFTLIELLVVSVVLIMLAMATLGLQTIISDTQKVSIDNYTNVNRINQSVSKMVREIRTAKVSESGTYPTESASDNEIIFYTDINFDGSVDRVRYTLSGTTLTKGMAEQLVVKDIASSPTFTLMNIYNADNSKIKT